MSAVLRFGDDRGSIQYEFKLVASEEPPAQEDIRDMVNRLIPGGNPRSSYADAVAVNGKSAEVTVPSDLPAGTYYFAVRGRSDKGVGLWKVSPPIEKARNGLSARRGAASRASFRDDSNRRGCEGRAQGFAPVCDVGTNTMYVNRGMALCAGVPLGSIERGPCSGYEVPRSAWQSTEKCEGVVATWDPVCLDGATYNNAAHLACAKGADAIPSSEGECPGYGDISLNCVSIPEREAPVCDIKTGKTFNNLYAAMCAGVPRSRLASGRCDGSSAPRLEVEMTASGAVFERDQLEYGTASS